MSDSINPKHYRTHPSGVECIEIAEPSVSTWATRSKILRKRSGILSGR